MTPAKKATKKVAPKKRKGYVITSDRLTLGARGEWLPVDRVPNSRSLELAGHIKAEDR